MDLASQVAAVYLNSLSDPGISIRVADAVWDVLRRPSLGHDMTDQRDSCVECKTPLCSRSTKKKTVAVLMLCWGAILGDNWFHGRWGTSGIVINALTPKIDKPRIDDFPNFFGKYSHTLSCNDSQNLLFNICTHRYKFINNFPLLSTISQLPVLHMRLPAEEPAHCGAPLSVACTCRPRRRPPYHGHLHPRRFQERNPDSRWSLWRVFIRHWCYQHHPCRLARAITVGDLSLTIV